MSINPMKRAAIAIDQRPCTCSDFQLGLNAAGWWVLRGTTRRTAGMFRSREAAIKFARDESPNGFFTIIYQPDGLEFEELIPRAA